jgi:predicted pyridoxine 5'-phosphate oxidase superfamily flavin-nucleotide-binding protein
LLAGPPGFMHTPDAQTLTIGARPHGADALSHTLRAGQAIGVLAIEPHTRRRNRLNGTVSAARDGAFSIAVQHSFGNCPKYIQARQARWVGDEAARITSVVRGSQLDAAGAALVGRADTYFIATSVPPADIGRDAALGVDVSHRGGKPGFVRVQRDADGADTLTVPDFSGNNAFNTLGNLMLHPRAGLLFVDFERAALMHLSVDTSIDWEGSDVAAFSGALRIVRHRVHAMLRIEGLPPLAWGAAQQSPFVQATGHWPLAAT